MRIAILGAGGQVGGALVRYLGANPNVEVVAVVRNRMAAANLHQVEGCTTRIGRVANPDDAANVLAGCDSVVNAALAVGLPRRSRDANAGVINSVAQAVQRGLSLKSFVQLSSIAVYGPCVHPSTGTTFERPHAEGGYGRDKLASERVARDAFRKAEARLYVIRLGHVYGPYQGHSKAILGEAESPTFALPFEGSRPSNAVRIDRLAATLALVCEGNLEPGTFNATDAPNACWREVFHWHTDALGVSAVRPLDDKASDEIRSKLLAMSRTPRLLQVVMGVGRAAGTAAVHEFLSSSAVRDLGHEVLVRLPSRVETYTRHLYTLVSARLQVQSFVDGPQGQISPWYFSEGVPGPNICELAQAAPMPNEVEIRRELQQWIAKSVGLSQPQ